MRHLAAMAAADAIAFNLINTTSYDCITRQCLTLRTVLVDNDPTSGSYRIIFYLGRVDGFYQDQAASESNERAIAFCCLFAP
jgi:hypothetical protein